MCLILVFNEVTGLRQLLICGTSVKGCSIKGIPNELILILLIVTLLIALQSSSIEKSPWNNKTDSGPKYRRYTI